MNDSLRTLHGHYEHVVIDKVKAERLLYDLCSIYKDVTGKRPDLQREAHNMTTSAGFTPETGEIFVINDTKYSHLLDGFFAEELVHFKDCYDKKYVGKTLDQKYFGKSLKWIQDNDPVFHQNLEAHAASYLKSAGFKRYDIRDYPNGLPEDCNLRSKVMKRVYGR
jgi:hypothetical protein